MPTSTTSIKVAQLLLLLVPFLALGCDTGGPEFASGETRIVEGHLEGEVLSASSFFLITQSGTVSIQLSTLVVVDVESGEPIENSDLAVSVGQPNPEDETICQATFSQLLEPGDAFSIFYPEGLFCVIGFRGPNAPTDTVVDYVLTLTGAFS
jgi:hypothetical protein